MTRMLVPADGRRTGQARYQIAAAVPVIDPPSPAPRGCTRAGYLRGENAEVKTVELRVRLDQKRARTLEGLAKRWDIPAGEALMRCLMMTNVWVSEMEATYKNDSTPYSRPARIHRPPPVAP